MDHAEIESRVASHYTRGDVTERIIQSLGLAGAAPGSVAVERLFPRRP